MKKYSKFLVAFMLICSLSFAGAAGFNSASAYADNSTTEITTGTVSEYYESDFYVIATDYAIVDDYGIKTNKGYGDFFIPGTTVISQGSYGESVKACQAGMQKIFIFKNRFNCWVQDVDSSFGPATNTAVRNFQRESGLTVDGYVGRNTWYRLQEECWNL